jgi:hypothetical protein
MYVHLSENKADLFVHTNQIRFCESFLKQNLLAAEQPLLRSAVGTIQNHVLPASNTGILAALRPLCCSHFPTQAIEPIFV